MNLNLFGIFNSDINVLSVNTSDKFRSTFCMVLCNGQLAIDRREEEEDEEDVHDDRRGFSTARVRASKARLAVDRLLEEVRGAFRIWTKVSVTWL